jgi:predicted NAD-dependent protein-ADP-ribosyltransferase YbiA (DUF1768 family)
MLLATTTSKIAEYAKYNRRWGIGYGLQDADKCKQPLWGDNKMGQILLLLRSEFQEKEKKKEKKQVVNNGENPEGMETQ